ncbi:MAG: hypothetical protein ABH951_01615 [Patescibacteria group bacterium]
MKNHKSKQSGAIVIATLWAISWLALSLSVAKGGEVIYDKVQTDAIAEGLQEQAQYLANQAPNLGKSGDLAVQESLRLNEASKDIEKEGLRSYSAELLKEGVGLSLGTVLGTAGKIGEGIGHVMNILGVKDNIIGAASGDDISEADRKFMETLKGSKDNIDDFELARRKAEVDEIARMKGELEDAGSKIDDLIAKQNQANAYWEQMKARAEQRSRDRLEALKNIEVQKALNIDTSTRPVDGIQVQVPTPVSVPTPIESEHVTCINECKANCQLIEENCINACVEKNMAEVRTYCADEMNIIRLRLFCQNPDYTDNTACFDKYWAEKCDTAGRTVFHTKWCTLGCGAKEEYSSCNVECYEKCDNLY